VQAAVVAESTLPLEVDGLVGLLGGSVASQNHVESYIIGLVV